MSVEQTITTDREGLIQYLLGLRADEQRNADLAKTQKVKFRRLGVCEGIDRAVEVIRMWEETAS